MTYLFKTSEYDIILAKMLDTRMKMLGTILEYLRRDYSSLNEVYSGRQKIEVKPSERQYWYDAMHQLRKQDAFNFIISDNSSKVISKKDFLTNKGIDFFVQILDPNREKVAQLYSKLNTHSATFESSGDLLDYYAARQYHYDRDPDYVLKGALIVEAYIIVKVDGRDYKFRNKYEQRPEKILHYINDKGLWGQQVQRSDLITNGVLSQRESNVSLKSIFRKSQFIAGALRPFANIEKNFLILHKEVQLDYGQRQKIMKAALKA